MHEPVTRRRALSANAGTQYFSSSQPTADRAAWADPGAFPLLIGQKSSSSGIGPQSRSKFRQSRRSNSYSRKRSSSVFWCLGVCINYKSDVAVLSTAEFPAWSEDWISLKRANSLDHTWWKFGQVILRLRRQSTIFFHYGSNNSYPKITSHIKFTNKDTLPAAITVGGTFLMDRERRQRRRELPRRETEATDAHCHRVTSG